jgi:nucleoside-diphosphate-sugar epimerase
MKKVLVTGATGFIGNYVVEHLLNQGNTVIASSSNREKASSYNWFNRVEYVEFDLKQFRSSDNYFQYFKSPDALIHLSWEGLPNYKSLFHFEENLPGHYDFLKNIITNGCNNISVTGTCFEYGMKEGKLSEDMCCIPDNPYALAKDSLNKFLHELSKQYPFTLKWIRLFYLFGKGQNPKSLFSQLDLALENGDRIFNMSGGEQVRDYLPVEMAAEYIVKVAMQNKVNGIINCCSGNPVKIKDMVEQYLFEKKKNIELHLGYYPYPDYEPMSFWGDNKKLQSILND